MLAVLVAVAQGESRNWAVPAVLLCVSIPQIALAPFAAPVLDRLGPRPIVVASGAAQVAALVCAAVFPELAVILCVLVFTASISALDSAGMLLLADRAPRETSSETAARAFARLDTARLLGSFIGPVLGGVALEHLSLSWVFLAEAAAVGVLALTAMFYPQVQWEAAGATATWWHRVKEAPALLFRNRVARVALTGLAAAIVFTSFFSAAQAIYGVETLDLSPIGVAVLAQAFVLGRLLGAHWAGRLTGDVAYRWLLIATLLMGGGAHSARADPFVCCSRHRFRRCGSGQCDPGGSHPPDRGGCGSLGGAWALPLDYGNGQPDGWSAGHCGRRSGAGGPGASWDSGGGRSRHRTGCRVRRSLRAEPAEGRFSYSDVTLRHIRLALRFACGSRRRSVRVAEMFRERVHVPENARAD